MPSSDVKDGAGAVPARGAERSRALRPRPAGGRPRPLPGEPREGAGHGEGSRDLGARAAPAAVRRKRGLLPPDGRGGKAEKAQGGLSAFALYPPLVKGIVSPS